MEDIELVLSVSRRWAARFILIQLHQQIPHVVLQVMSSERTPILSGAIPAFEMFMTTWEKIIREHPRLKKYVEPGLEWAYRYYRRMDRPRAYVIAMGKHIFWC
jgi:hypothetical protein